LLDEIGEMPMATQAKLLRVLEDRHLRRLGSRQEIAVNVRVLAATNRPPAEAVAAGQLRNDLYYRLNVFHLHLPPLREHLEDLADLCSTLLQQLNQRHGRKVEQIAPAVLQSFRQHHWPGNVRELRNTLERAMIVARGPRIECADLAPDFGASPEGAPKILAEDGDSIRVPVGATVDEAERLLILKTLAKENNNKTRAAERLGISLKPCKISSRSTQPAARARRRETRAAARFVFHSLFPAPQGEFPLRALPKLKLKHKLTLSIAVLVLVVVVAVNLVFLASSVHQQLQDTFEHANFLAQEIYSELGQELDAAYQQGAMPAAPDALNQFFQGRAQSPALASLFSAGIGYNGTIRDVALVNPQGVVVVDSNPLLEGQIQPRRRLMSDILDSGIWRQVQTVMGPEAIYSVSLATEVEQHPLGTITV